MKQTQRKGKGEAIHNVTCNLPFVALLRRRAEWRVSISKQEDSEGVAAIQSELKVQVAEAGARIGKSKKFVMDLIQQGPKDFKAAAGAGIGALDILQKCAKTWALLDEARTVFSFSVERPGNLHRSGLFYESDNQRPRTRIWPTVNALEVRDAFFSISSVQTAESFFRAYGPFEIDYGNKGFRTESLQFGTNALIEYRTRDFMPVDPTPEDDWEIKAKPLRWTLLLHMQAFLKRALTTEPQEFWEPIPLYLQLPKSFHLELAAPEEKSPTVFAPCMDVCEAIKTSIVLDRLARGIWKICARPDCGAVFPQTSRRTKLYCSYDCAHLQAVRNSNIEKEKRSKSRKRARRA